MRLPAFCLPLWLILFLVFLSESALVAQSDTIEQLIYDTLFIGSDFFNEDNPFHCTMEFDIKSYQKKKFDGNYIPVKTTYCVLDSLSVEKTLRVKARGTLRRAYCGLPPFWLNFKKDKMQIDQLQGAKKVKIVTHCRSGKAHNQYVLKEYLVYKIYNLISPYSFKVRLTEIKYIDTGRNNKTYSYWAFIIEPEELMANRLSSVPLKYDNLSLYHCDSVHTDIMAIFQYFIGNTDYSIAGRHNIKLIKEIDPFKQYPIPVPYDFDYAGIVNTHYAVPTKTLGIKNVTERYFQGPCRTDDEFEKALSVIVKKEDAILRMVEEFPYLNKKAKNEMLKYLQSFFTNSKPRSFISSEFRGTCREHPD